MNDPSHHYNITKVENGWTCNHTDDQGITTCIVGVEGSIAFEDEHDAFVAFLESMVEYFGPSDSKYSQKRIRVITVPGNSYEGPLTKEQKEFFTDMKFYLTDDGILD